MIKNGQLITAEFRFGFSWALLKLKLGFKWVITADYRLSQLITGYNYRLTGTNGFPRSTLVYIWQLWFSKSWFKMADYWFHWLLR